MVWFSHKKKLKVSQKGRAIFNPNGNILLDTSSRGVIAGKAPGHVDVKADTPVIFLSALILPLIYHPVFIHSFNKHPWGNDWLCALWVSIQKEVVMRLNPCPEGVEEEEKKNEKIVTTEKDGKQALVPWGHRRGPFLVEIVSWILVGNWSLLLEVGRGKAWFSYFLIYKMKGFK